MIMKNRKHKTNQFQQTESYQPKTEGEQLLVDAFSSFKNHEDAEAFLRDLLTLAEIEEFSNRILTAKKLIEGQSYLAISQELKVSTTTVTRVAHWLFKGCGGYYKVLSKKGDPK